MISGKIIIKSETGLHLRPASDLCNLAISYPCKIDITINDRIINAKSVLGVLSACIRHNDEITLICDGAREEEAFHTISQYLDDDFARYHKK